MDIMDGMDIMDRMDGMDEMDGMDGGGVLRLQIGNFRLSGRGRMDGIDRIDRIDGRSFRLRIVDCGLRI
jgi:hypothetical protein